MAPKRIVFSMIGILGSDVLFRSKHGYYLTRGGRDYRVSFCEKIPHNSLAPTGTEGSKPVKRRRLHDAPMKNCAELFGL
jgi:hypothetical protein